MLCAAFENFLSTSIKMHAGMEDEISCVFLKYSEKEIFQGVSIFMLGGHRSFVILYPIQAQ